MITQYSAIEDYKLMTGTPIKRQAEYCADQLIADLTRQDYWRDATPENKTEELRKLFDEIDCRMSKSIRATALKSVLHERLIGRPFRTKPTRQTLFDSSAEACFKLLIQAYHLVLQEIETIYSPDSELRLQWLFFLSTVHGGLCNHEMLDALAAKLDDKNKFITYHNGYLSIQLLFNSEAHPTNYMIAENRFTSRIWYPDPISFAALLGVLKCGKSILPLRKSAFCYIEELLKRTLSDASVNVFKNDSWLHGLSLLFERLPTHSCPAFLGATIRGKITSCSDHSAMSQIIVSRPMFTEISESSGVLTSTREKQSTEHNSYYEKIFLADV